MTFPPTALHVFTGTMSPSDFLSRISCSRFIITCSTYSLLERQLKTSRVTDYSQRSTRHALQPRSSSMTLVKSHHRMLASRRGTLSPYLLETYEAKSLQLTLAACCLAHTVLNIWSHLRLSDACYPVADLPCRDGIYTRWNYRPCSAAHPFLAFFAHLVVILTNILYFIF